MFEFICIASGLIILAGAVYAYHKTKDGFHPAVVVAPVMIYGYSVWPAILNADGDLEKYFSMLQLEYVAVLYFLSIVFLYAGLLKMPPRRSARAMGTRGFQVWREPLTAAAQKKVYALSVCLGLVSIVAYLYMVHNVGGFVEAYGRPKGGGRAESGYIGEAILFSFPAIIMLALSRRGQTEMRPLDIALALLMASPHLLQGTFGGRRGPIFLVLAVLFFAWHIAKGRQPSLKGMVVGISMIGFAVVVVWSQRQQVYLGSQGQFEGSRIYEKIVPEELGTGNTYLAGVASVITADHHQDFYWGYRYLVTVFVRPIPKQIWPTKYQDVGAAWLNRYGDEEQALRYHQAVGFVPVRGFATGYIADVYMEFSWGVLLLSYILGRAYAAAWKAHRLRGGLWTVIFVSMLILCVYLPTQSLSAWFHRLLFVSVFSSILWRYWIQGEKALTQSPVVRVQRGGSRFH